jgi:hypothetical protein
MSRLFTIDGDQDLLGLLYSTQDLYEAALNASNLQHQTSSKRTQEHVTVGFTENPTSCIEQRSKPVAKGIMAS